MTRKKIERDGQNKLGHPDGTTMTGPKHLLEHMVTDYSKHYTGKVEASRAQQQSELVFEPVSSQWFQIIAKSIAPARRKKYLTQRQLASFLHTSQARISLLERGLNNPTVEFLDRVFRVLGIEVEVKTKY